MNDAALDHYRRWAAAEASERDDDADAALQGLFQAVESEALVSPEFTTRTMTTIADAAARDARRARRARVAVLSGTAAATAAALYTGAGWAFSLLSAAFLGFLNLLIAAVVSTAEAFQSGAGVWGVLSSLGLSHIGAGRGFECDLRDDCHFCSRHRGTGGAAAPARF